MRTVKKWLCFFEQSGTFRDKFRELGFKSYDYDIQNQYGKTDYVCDLFKAFNEWAFWDDLDVVFGQGQYGIIAFFPCVRCEVQTIMHWNCTAHQLIDKSIPEKMRYTYDFARSVLDFYGRLCKLVEECCKRDIPLIIENPYSTQSFLIRYFPVKPSIIDFDRRENCDYYKKPTAFWFINCEPQQGVVFDEPLVKYKRAAITSTAYGKDRSIISPEYASRFIKSYIMGGCHV